MIRLWYKDGTYMDAMPSEAEYYENDPEWHHSVILWIDKTVLMSWGY